MSNPGSFVPNQSRAITIVGTTPVSPSSQGLRVVVSVAGDLNVTLRGDTVAAPWALSIGNHDLIGQFKTVAGDGTLVVTSAVALYAI